MINMFIHIGLQSELKTPDKKYDYTCKKPHCEYCYQMNRVEMLNQPPTELILKSAPVKKYRYKTKRSKVQPHYKWTQEELDLLLTVIDVPIPELVIKGIFGEHTHYAIRTKKSILRKQHGLQPKRRNYRIYHN